MPFTFYQKNPNLKPIQVPSLSESLKLPSVVSVKYNITRQIGQGGHGIVFEGISTIDQKRVAVKIVRKKNISHDSWVTSNNKKMPTEVYILSTYIHDGIISILDFYDHQEYVYIIMEFFGSSWDYQSD
jgi:serine/threonine protein kinase